MDNYENDRLNNEPTPENIDHTPTQPQEQPAQSCGYNNAGVGRKESPFADSPYVMDRQPQYAAPRKEKKAKKPGTGKVWKRILAAVLVIALVGGTCAVTAISVNNSWFKKAAMMNEAYEQKLEEEQEEQLDEGADQEPVTQTM